MIDRYRSLGALAGIEPLQKKAYEMEAVCLAAGIILTSYSHHVALTHDGTALITMVGKGVM
jgi:hypothetical protein